MKHSRLVILSIFCVFTLSSCTLKNVIGGPSSVFTAETVEQRLIRQGEGRLVIYADFPIKSPYLGKVCRECMLAIAETEDQLRRRASAAVQGREFPKESEKLYLFVHDRGFRRPIDLFLVSEDYAKDSLGITDLSERQRVARLLAEERESQRQAQIALAKEKKLADERRIQQEAEVRKRSELAREEGIKAEMRKLLSAGAIGVYVKGSDTKSTYLCGWAGIESGAVLNPDCHFKDKNTRVIRLLSMNNTAAVTKDVTFKCDQIAKSGTRLRSTEKTFYDIWEPNVIKETELELFWHPQAVKVMCTATAK